MTLESFCRVATKKYIREKIDHFGSFLHSQIFIKWISSQVYSIVYHLNGLSGNTNIRYNQFPAQDMIFFNFEKKIMEINGHKADEIDAF